MRATRSWWSVVAGLVLAGAGLVPAGGPLVAAAAPVQVLAPSAPVVSEFSDVPVGAPFRLEIGWLASAGISTGYADGTFHPVEAVSRQAMAAFLYRYAGRPEYTPPVTARFADVPTSHAFYAEISWLAEQGITTGYADGSFHPTEAVSRQAMAAFLYRYAHRPAFSAPATPTFGDVPTGAGFFTEVEWLSSTGITTGYADHTFHPVEDVSRQAMAAFLFRYRAWDPVPVDSMDYTLGETTTEAASGEVVGVTITAGDVPVDAGGNPTGEPAAWSATVTLAAGADVPGVGEYFVVSPGDLAHPAGLAGVVTAVVDNGDGTFTLSLGPAALDEVFADLEVHYAGPVGDGTVDFTDPPVGGAAVAADAAPTVASLSATSVLAAAGTQAPTAQAMAAATGAVLECRDDAGALITDTDDVTASITFERVHTNVDLVLGALNPRPSVAIWISAQPVITLSGTMSVGGVCTLAPAWQNSHKKVIPVGTSGVTLSFAPYVQVSFDAGVTLEVTKHTYWLAGWVTEPDGTIQTLKAGHGDPLEFTASGGVSANLEAGMITQLGYLDRVGVYGKAGLSLNGSLTVSNGGPGPQVCADWSVDLATHWGIYLDAWVKRWEGQPLDVILPLTGDQGCETLTPPVEIGSPVITSTTLPPGTVGLPYTTTLTTADARAGTWTITGTLSPGLTSTEATTEATITGTPTQTGTWDLDLSFVDPQGRSDAASVTLHVAEPSNLTTTRVSATTDGTPANGHSYDPSVSADGRWITYFSDASNLVAGDTNGAWDLFVTDRTTGLTTLVSAGPDGTPANGNSYDPSVSADGRWITYTSFASNLVSSDTNSYWDAFVTDRTTGLTTLVSAAPDGTSANSYSDAPSLSADGRWITYYSYASNLVAGDTNNNLDVFVSDRTTGVTTLVSAAPDGTPANGHSLGPSVSADGRWITYISSASNLVAGDTNDVSDVFVTDRTTGVTTLVSAAPDGTPANNFSEAPSVSADGRWITYTSVASNLVAGDTNGNYDVFVTDRTSGVTALVSVAPNGAPVNGPSDDPSVSGDGRWIAYESNANGGGTQVLVSDRTTGVTTLVSAAPGGTPANSFSGSPSVSGDGRWITYTSYASNLVEDDADGHLAVFVTLNPGMP